ncbi:MAG TPA: hypothetical protein VFS57_05020 [Gemmatimonadaceae bacterium]|nr:hypothetical protein [Gemmatimonadaceae bacterium]
MFRSSAAGIVVATLGAAGVLGATAIRGRSSVTVERPRAEQNAPSQPRASDVQVAAQPIRQPVNTNSPAPKPTLVNASVSTGNVAITPPAPKAPARAPFTPVVPQGRSELADSITVTRRDSVVVLSFDTKMARTRLPDKFERFVRATLPTIYGAGIDSVLTRVPVGALVGQGDLVNELPTRGMRIPASSGWTITLYPMTRPGLDGPLVVKYRVSVVKG